MPGLGAFDVHPVSEYDQMDCDGWRTINTANFASTVAWAQMPPSTSNLSPSVICRLFKGTLVDTADANGYRPLCVYMLDHAGNARMVCEYQLTTVPWHRIKSDITKRGYKV